MKKRYKGLIAASSSLMLFGLLTPFIARKASEPVEPDNVVYDDPAIVDYDKPHFYKKAADTSATGFELHYHNEDGDGNSREFWVWCDGVDGSAFNPTTVSSDGKDITLRMDFTGNLSGFAKKRGIYFIVKYTIASGKGGGNGWVGKSDNTFIEYEKFEPNADGICVVWCIPGEGSALEVYKTEQETKMDRFFLANFVDWKRIEIIATAAPSSWKLYALTSSYMSKGMMQQQTDLPNYCIAEGVNPQCTSVTINKQPYKKFTIDLRYTPRINVQYYLTGEFPEWKGYTKTKYVASDQLYETQRFHDFYEYQGNDLGVTYTSEKSTFKVWAPTSARVRLLIYECGTNEDLARELKEKGQDVKGDNNARGYTMAYRPGGIWEVTVNGDLNGKYYNYYVVNSLGTNEVTDPYAKAVGVNGERGMIVDFSKTNPEGWNNIPLKWDGVSGFDIKTPNELSVYETHIRDLTMDKTWVGNSMPGTYAAFGEKGTKYTKGNVTVTTGFDHIKDLGIKAVQIIPFFDNANVEQIGSRSYNWGYNPLNYNALDGGYASDPYNGDARIKEFKQMLQNYANNPTHTRIIMDVVYNHVNSAPDSNFNRLMPKYYFRMTDGGDYYDGSGCGNEVKSEAPMMSKFIVESLCWWAKEYKIKGFRFDLMALIDFQTIKKAAQELYKIDPDIYLYGEGWSADGSAGNMKNHEPGDPYYGNWGANSWTVYNKLAKQGNMCYVGCFNNGGRNSIAGETGNVNDWGFIDQGPSYVGDKSETVADMLAGIHRSPEDGTFKRLYDGDTWMYDPNQCINYASCHDDFALFDHLNYALNGDINNKNFGVVCAATAAVESTIMFGNGVAFMQGGEEIFRSKEVSAEDLAKYGTDRTVEIRGVRVTDNAYRSSDYTNAFRWDRKIDIEGIKTTGYVNAIADAIKARNKMARYDKAHLDPYNSQADMNIWGQGNGKNVIGMKNGDYFFFLAGAGNDGEGQMIISFDAISTYKNKVFCSNPASGGYTPYASSIGLGWYTCVCLTK